MTTNPRTERAIALMIEFARRTGLTGSAPQRRYLWTDAFAVCNFLGLACDTGEPHYLQLALDLVDRVHHSLGRQRDDSGLHGWLSGLSEQEGEGHPTIGDLRIGKKLPERRPDEPFDERLEWDRDGQYFHYLTKWMHALDQVSRATGQPQFNLWARELAQTAFQAFSDAPAGGRPRTMHWKMSIDLSRPLVPSMGQHDPLDGYITCLQLRATSAHFVRKRLRSLLTFASLGNDIESFWSDPEHQQAPSWEEHRDINEVMLATSLAPEGFLTLGAGSG